MYKKHRESLRPSNLIIQHSCPYPKRHACIDFLISSGAVHHYLGLRCVFLPTGLVLVPIRQHIADPRAVSQAVYLLEVFFGKVKWLCCDVGNVLPNQFARIDRSLINLLQQEASERLDSRSQECTVERHVNSLEGDGGEAALQLDRLGFGFTLLCAFLDDFNKVSLDIIQGECFDQRVDIDLLGFEEVGDTREAVERSEISGADVLHVGDVVVDNLQ